MRLFTRIQLDGAAPDGAIRFLSELPRLSLDGDKPTSWVTVTRTNSKSRGRC
jgi:hypothetical protein